MKSKLLLFSLVIVMCVVFSLSVFASNNVVRIPTRQDPQTLSPILTYGDEKSWASNQLFSPLVKFDVDKLEGVPNLATSWEVSDDNLVWTFHLRKDAKWTDGHPVTAHDIEYGIKRVIDPATASPNVSYFYLIKNVEKISNGESNDFSSVGIKAVDDYTIQYTLEAPAAYFLAMISHISAALPSWVIEEYGDEWALPENIVTNGPYKLKSWAAYNEIHLVKNEDYFNADKVQIDEAKLIYIADQSTALSMYIKGSLDTCDIPPVDLDRIKSDPILSKEYHNPSRSAVQMIHYNSEFPPFDNTLVRKAFAASIDRETLVKYITKGGEQPAYTVVPPGCFGHVEEEEGIGIRFDPEKAKKYLADAGYPEGEGLPEVSFSFGSSEFNRNLAQAYQKMWKDNLGVNVKLNSVEDKMFTSNLDAPGKGAYQMWRMGFGARFPDAHKFHFINLHPRFGEGRMHWENEEYDKIVIVAGSERDPEKREALYRRAEEIICEEECALVPVCYYAYNFLVKPYLKRTFSPTRRLAIEDWKIEK